MTITLNDATEDWLRTRTWDLWCGTQLVTSLPQLLYALGVPGETVADQQAAVQHFTTLPAWQPAPDTLKQDVTHFLTTGETLVKFSEDQPRNDRGEWSSGGGDEPSWEKAQGIVREASKGTPYGTQDPAVHEASTTSDHPRYFYHQTRSTNRESIAETGLQAGRSLGGRNTRVYLDSQHEPPQPRLDTKPLDYYRVDTQGLSLRPDPELPGRWAISGQDISPDRLELLSTTDPDKPIGKLLKFQEDQPRDDHGRWSSDGGGVSTDRLNDVDSRVRAGETVSVQPHELPAILNKWAGEKDKGTVDLTKLQVEGKGNENLFRAPAGGSARVDMPVIPQAEMSNFRDFLTAKGVGASIKDADPRELKATQSELDGVKAGQMLGRIRDSGGEDKTLIAAGNNDLVDGHHRWAGAAAYAIEKPGSTVPVLKVDAPIADVVKLGKEFQAAQGIEARGLGEGVKVVKYDEDQERDDHGRWMSTGGVTPEIAKNVQAHADAFKAAGGTIEKVTGTGNYFKDSKDGTKERLQADLKEAKPGPWVTFPTPGGRGVVTEPGASHAQSAISLYDKPPAPGADPTTVLVARDAGGKIAGALDYAKDEDGHIHIGYVGSLQTVPGTGSALALEVAKAAASQGTDVRAEYDSTEAKTWHEAIGRRVSEPVTRESYGSTITEGQSLWTKDDVNALAAATKRAAPCCDRDHHAACLRGEYEPDCAHNAKAVKLWRPLIIKYSEDQPRDDHGRFTSGGGGDEKEEKPSGLAGAGAFGITSEVEGLQARADKLSTAMGTKIDLTRVAATYQAGVIRSLEKFHDQYPAIHVGVSGAHPDDGPLTKFLFPGTGCMASTYTYRDDTTIPTDLSFVALNTEYFGPDLYGRAEVVQMANQAMGSLAVGVGDVAESSMDHELGHALGNSLGDIGEALALKDAMDKTGVSFEDIGVNRKSGNYISTYATTKVSELAAECVAQAQGSEATPFATAVRDSLTASYVEKYGRT